MSKLLNFRCLVSLVLIWPGSFCLAQPVKIRVIDAHDGHPLGKQHVSLALLYEKGERTQATPPPNLIGETDANGEVQFQIDEPFPSHFSVMVRMTSEYLNCGCWVLGDTKDLIQKGIIGPPPSARREKSDTPPRVAPGEVVVLTRPMSFFERLLYPLVKE